MYVLRAVSSAPQTELLTMLSTDAVFCALLEANINDPSQYEGGVLRRLLLEAQRHIEPGDELFSPEEFANAIDEVLKKWNQDEGRYQVVFYAGVLVHQGRAAICTAGDIRVHLVKDGQVVATTKDHNLIDDPPEDPEGALKHLLPEFLFSVPTRCLDGTLNHGVPETLHWQIEKQDSIVICTSQFHKYVSPQSYLPLLSQVFSPSPSGSTGGEFWGAVAEIAWR
jgi:hypothetical protein